MNDVVAIVEREPGPSWERSNWPIDELDEINLGLDPTQATIEKVGKAASERGRGCGRKPRRDPPRCRRFDPGDDADPHLSRARSPRGQPRSIGRGARAISRPTSAPNITVLPRPTSTGRSGFAASSGSSRPPSGRSSRCFRTRTAATSASSTCTSTRSKSGASSRSASRARKKPSSSPLRASSRSSPR